MFSDSQQNPYTDSQIFYHCEIYKQKEASLSLRQSWSRTTNMYVSLLVHMLIQLFLSQEPLATGVTEEAPFDD